MRRTRLLLPLTAALLALSAAPALAAPANDDFADAPALGSSGAQSFPTTTVAATTETGEPYHWGQGRSVWYRWTPSATGGTHLAACGYGLRIAVYTGTSVGGLTKVGGGGGKCAGDTVFRAEAGKTYRIAVDADTNPAGVAGTVTLKQVTTTPNLVLGAPLVKTGRAGDVPLVETTGAEGLYFQVCDVVGQAAQAGQCFWQDPMRFHWQGLATGSHTLKVTVRDFYGNVDPTPLTHTWTVDGDPPETAITSPAPAQTDTQAVFSFASSEPGSTFECSYDGAPFKTCAMPWGVPVATFGGHWFRVRAFDAYGNGDATPAQVSWVRQDPKPVVTTTTTTPTTTTTTPGTTSPTIGTTTGSATTYGVRGEPCRVAVRLLSSPALGAVRRGVRVALRTAAGCRTTATLRRGTTTLVRWRGTGSTVRTVRLSRTALAKVRRGSRLTLAVRAAGPAGGTTATVRLRVR